MTNERLVLTLNLVYSGCCSTWNSYANSAKHCYSVHLSIKVYVISASFMQVSALNEAIQGSAKSVFRSWEQRLNSAGVNTSKINVLNCDTVTP